MTPPNGLDQQDEQRYPGGSLHVVLYRPEIPQNTGNVARTCAATHTPLHLVEPLGFQLSDRYLKRAGLDYWPHVRLEVHPGWGVARERLAGCRLVLFSTRGELPYHHFGFRPGDCLVFGSETTGLPQELFAAHPDHVVHLPIDRTHVRSLNLSTAVGIALFEAIRQLTLDEHSVAPLETSRICLP
ncbi:MAG TPA: tRNA (uridine(34)/cytosine(34)/5-carboxymethylaminomethyluridine(34)-2'-O)-methyltransferase TrmL [Syntrophobacteraceae bacterium]|nr:tRNA (uridine(34)/cytosine(34)/5-carboxymethylaminomethyluridine(34)-2'-O)-methyltransferase TrmL [Syntrophobacteraceae bacterium]HBZ54954.1 tRNA (uridine(34)/cytosine(34)/5-carboxymethylaminomethyluridine(34)-2'-O)-methyltransferase TrmL [Syntrophobacteraceae bacterium]